MWASILVVINNKRLTAEKSTIGFVSPTMYAHSESFTDIVSGSNPMGVYGLGEFTALHGWNPAAGAGTPNTAALSDGFMSLP